MGEHGEYYDKWKWDWIERPRKKKTRKQRGLPPARKRGRKLAHPKKPRCPEMGPDGRTRAQEFRDMFIVMEACGWGKTALAWYLGVSRQIIHKWLSMADKNDQGEKTAQPHPCVILHMRDHYRQIPPMKRDHERALRALEEMDDD